MGSSCHSSISWADLLFKEGHLPEAEKLQRQVLETQARVLGPENPDTLASQSNLAKTLIAEGHSRDAETLARQAFDVQLRTLGPQDPDSINTLQQLGTAMVHNRRYPEAKQLFHGVINKVTSSKQVGDVSLIWYAFACVAVAADHPDDAIENLRESVSHGFRDADGLAADNDLRSLRQNSDFQQLVAQLKQKANSKP